jgi:YgiT-type zinc finger domain-containing protein
MKKDNCPLCGGDFHNDFVIFTADLKPGILVIKDVPARVCNHCGYESLSYDTSIKIETIAEASRKKEIEIEVLKFNAA